MVSDAMSKFVFLSMPVSGRIFSARGKATFPLFFTVKQIFLKIKLWLEKSAAQEN